MYMPTEISQKNIFSKLAAKLTIPVGGLCSNKFQIRKKNVLLNHQQHWNITKSIPIIPKALKESLQNLKPWTQMNQELKKKLGLFQVCLLIWGSCLHTWTVAL